MGDDLKPNLFLAMTFFVFLTCTLVTFLYVLCKSSMSGQEQTLNLFGDNDTHTSFPSQHATFLPERDHSENSIPTERLLTILLSGGHIYSHSSSGNSVAIALLSL